MSNTELADTLRDIGSEKFDGLSDDQTAIIYEKISRRELSKEQLAAIIQTSPTFVNGFVDTVKTMAKTASELSEAHKNAVKSLEIVKTFVEPLNTLAKQCESKEERIALAENIQNVVLEICNTIAKIQKENNMAIQEFSNNLGKRALALLAAFFLGAISVCIVAAYCNNRKDTPSKF